MGLDSLSDDDAAVAPVIGVVLLFAISVALAAVTAGVVVATDDLIQTNPQASFDFDYESGDTGSTDLSTGSDTGALTITHAGGDTIDAENIEVRAQPGGTAGDTLDWSGQVTAGTSTAVTVDADATVRLVHTTAGGSTVLVTWDGRGT